MRRVLALAVLAALTLPAGARADAATIASVPARTPLAAYGGWVVWSAPGADGYRLTAWHGGAPASLPVAPRPEPFDVDLGPDAHGRVVATYSRCPRPAGACAVRVLDLAAGRERTAGIPRAPGQSDRHPSMWRGRIAFARRDPRRHKDVEQVLLWSLGRRAPTPLPHGGVPVNCPYRHKSDCVGQPVVGRVLGLDLGPGLVTFLWGVRAPAVIGHGGYEVRAVRLGDRGSVLVGSGYAGEVCTGGPDAIAPSTPGVRGGAVVYSELTVECYRYSSALLRYGTQPAAGSTGRLDGIVLQVASDGTALYAMVAPENPSGEEARCDRPAAPCLIRRIATPPLSPVARRPHPPFF